VVYYFGGLADKVQGSVIPLDKKGYSISPLRPLGVVVAITPWNSAADAHRLESWLRALAQAIRW